MGALIAYPQRKAQQGNGALMPTDQDKEFYAGITCLEDPQEEDDSDDDRPPPVAPDDPSDEDRLPRERAPGPSTQSSTSKHTPEGLQDDC